MAKRPDMTLAYLAALVVFLFAVLMFGTWYRNEAFQNPPQRTAAQEKALAYQASARTTTQDPSKTMDFNSALNNVIKTTGTTDTSSRGYAAKKGDLYSSFYRK